MHNADILRTWETYKLKLKHITPDQGQKIDEYLGSVGDYGEVSLVVQNGELRYINKIVSFRAIASDNEKIR